VKSKRTSLARSRTMLLLPIPRTSAARSNVTIAQATTLIFRNAAAKGCLRVKTCGRPSGKDTIVTSIALSWLASALGLTRPTHAIMEYKRSSCDTSSHTEIEYTPLASRYHALASRTWRPARRQLSTALCRRRALAVQIVECNFYVINFRWVDVASVVGASILWGDPEMASVLSHFDSSAGSIFKHSGRIRSSNGPRSSWLTGDNLCHGHHASDHSRADDEVARE